MSFLKMINNNAVIFTCLFSLPALLSVTCGGPIESSPTTEVNRHPLLERKLESIEQLFTHINDSILTQNANHKGETDAIGVTTTSKPLILANESLPSVLEVERLNGKNVGLVNHQEHKAQSSSVFVAAIVPNPKNRLFYPSESVDQHKYWSAKHYVPAPREAQYYHLTRRENNSPFRQFESAPIRPKHLGFPPVSNTRENLGKKINWNAKIGRAQPSFYEYLIA